ncbi:hypothetical protein RTG_03009 [Rhodotorula toruloides ATCC 204091]|uniref:Uncharacterized protein n=1 Tax=Rhodotorula toruloides TaxID=5286 RepID=A0A0K3CLR5_RHOTO|nr:hypothetical protein RTG_03009 [Rhodotorula toruloides ATCC 204091]PRQ72046.1 hypothetical protein AAT19DRAFT_9385 [Rhodotorula toruloides]
MPPKAGPSRTSSSSGAPNYGSLTDIVSSLTRAQVGSAAASVADDELDKHIAEMLLKEAKQKDKMWGERGTRAYFDPDKEKTAAIRKPNTRFLSAVIRNVDDHNTALRRADEAAARKREQVERQAAEEWRRERRGEREDGRDRRRRDEDEEEERRRDGSVTRETRPMNDGTAIARLADTNVDLVLCLRVEETTTSAVIDLAIPPVGELPRTTVAAGGATLLDGKNGGKERDLDEIFAEVDAEVERQKHSHRSKRHRRSPSAPLPASPPPPVPSDPLPSKMDRYFSENYDPRLDYSLDDVTDRSTGLIAEGAFDTWDRMLDVVKARKEDKKEKELREKLERKAERDRIRKEREERRKRKRRHGSDSDGSSEDEVGPRYDPKSELMDMQYAKKGKTREWDLGKETPT